MAGKKLDERTNRMMAEYCDLFERGLTPKEIAKRFGLSSHTVYKHLDTIALRSQSRKRSYTREQLLEAPEHSGERAQFNGLLREVEPLDVEGIKHAFNEAEASLKEAASLLDGATKE